MYRHILISTVLLFGTLSTIAQKEIYFNTASVDKKDIKVEKTLQGVYLNTEFLKMIGSDFGRYYTLDAHYFREDRIAPTLTMHSFAGIQNWFDRGRYNAGNGSFSDGDLSVPMRTFYDMHLQVGTELRWHVGYRPRYVRNKKVTNNTGWFVGVPVCFTTYLLNQPRSNVKQWLPDAFNANITLGAKAGYRYAFNKHWLLEASLAYVPVYFILSPYSNYFYLSEAWVDMFRLELKAAYTF